METLDTKARFVAPRRDEMFERIMKVTEEADRTDGAVDRPEFEQDYPTGVDLSEEQRAYVEDFVFRRTRSNHRFMTAEGHRGIVYFDIRGRATSSAVHEIDNNELVWLARLQGWDQDKQIRPVGGRAVDHGYRPPTEA